MSVDTLLEQFDIQAPKKTKEGIHEHELRHLLDYLLEYGFTRRNMRLIFTRRPSALRLTRTQAEQQFLFLEEQYFKRNQVVKIVKTFPPALTIPKEQILQVIQLFESRDYTPEDIRDIIIRCSAVLGYSTGRTRNLLDFFEEVGQDIRDRPGGLMFSFDVLFARRKFLERECLAPDARLLLSHAQFEERFGISRDKLLKL